LAYQKAIWPVCLACAGAILLNGCLSDSGDAESKNIVITVIDNEQTPVSTLPAENGDNGNDNEPDEGASQQPTTPVNDSPAGITDLILVTGQSNALGENTDFDPALDSPIDRVYAWTEDNGWQRASLRQVWDRNWSPRTHPDSDPHNNFGFHFAKTVATQAQDRVVGFVLVTAPGEGISHWDYNTYFYNEVSRKALEALNALPHKQVFDGILWHQGETDWLLNGSSDPDLNGVVVGDNYYSDKLSALIANFRTENWFARNGLFICGETAQAPVNARLMALNTDPDPATACVTGDGLPTFDQPDYVHFTAEALRELGGNYAEKYLELTDR